MQKEINKLNEIKYSKETLHSQSKNKTLYSSPNVNRFAKHFSFFSLLNWVVNV